MTPMLGIMASQITGKLSTKPPVSGYQVWLDASDTSTITVSTNAVTQWTDKSTNAYTFTQGTGTARPTSGVTTRNSKNVITFDGGDNLYSTAAASTWAFLHSSTSTVFIAAKNDLTTYGVIMGTNNDTGANRGISIGQNNLANGDISVYATSVSLVTVNNVTASGLIGTATYYYTSIVGDISNGTAANRSIIKVKAGTDQKNNAATGTPSGSAPTYSLQIGAAGNNAGALTGAICEIIIYPSILNSTDITSVNSYLATKWAI